MSSSEETRGTVAAYPAGQRLSCETCGAEIAIVKPCTCQPPDQSLQCCGRDMRPSVSAPVEDTWEA